MDFSGPVNGHKFLVVVDAHSKWLEIFPMQKADTHLITILKQLFSQHGLPEKLVSDNGSEFTSEIFHHISMHAWCITHVWSPPYHRQCNGQTEHFGDPFKLALLKAKKERTTEEILNTFLLSYRSTANGTVKNRMSLEEALMGRKLQTTLDPLCSQKQ